MTTHQHLLHDDQEITVETTASPPLAHEALWMLDWARLRASGVYRGEGVARGHGEPVIVVPGFLGSYGGMRELGGWLTRMGYRVLDPGFEWNIDCPDVLLAKLERQIQRVTRADGGRVTLIGHSLGGSLARAAAIRMPRRVARVITLGSPLRSMRAHPVIVELAQLLAIVAPSRALKPGEHEHGASCSGVLAATLARPFPVAVARTAIYSRSDGIVDWHSCIDHDAAGDVQVEGTHVGLIVNAAAYAAIGSALAADGLARAVSIS
jgi:pimeloyl-ACP methyl ester carboxylesterase